MQFTVFTSILDGDLKRKIAREMCRVLKPDGQIIWYDYQYNNPRNPNVRGVGKSEVQALFPGYAVDLRRITLAPPLARRIARLSRLMCLLLERLPPLCTHYFGAIHKA
jgi:hypothetical protein